MQLFKNITILLASQSPRRRALLKELGFEVKIVSPPDVNEIFPNHLQGAEIPVYLSKLKADAYTEKLTDNEILLTADTIVWINNKVIGKPLNRDEAIKMLSELSGNIHQVFTGVCLTFKGIRYTFFDETKVFFRKLTTEEITYYVDTFQPFDKAGAYGVQEWIGFVGVERMEGSYFNVMGLPTHKIYAEVLKLIK